VAQEGVKMQGTKIKITVRAYCLRINCVVMAIKLGISFTGLRVEVWLSSMLKMVKSLSVNNLGISAIR
jgi:hypothetical protein